MFRVCIEAKDLVPLRFEGHADRGTDKAGANDAYLHEETPAEELIGNLDHSMKIGPATRSKRNANFVRIASKRQIECLKEPKISSS